MTRAGVSRSCEPAFEPVVWTECSLRFFAVSPVDFAGMNGDSLARLMTGVFEAQSGEERIMRGRMEFASNSKETSGATCLTELRKLPYDDEGIVTVTSSMKGYSWTPLQTIEGRKDCIVVY